MPFPPINDAALQALAHVARVASAEAEVNIVLVPQHDVQFSWGAAAVHPMQALETHYQRIVRDAEERGRDPVERRTFESTALSGFYYFDAGPPRLLGVERDRPYRGDRFPLPVDALRHARAELAAAEGMVRAGMPLPVLATRIADARAAAWRVCALFTPPANPVLVNAPAIALVERLIEQKGTPLAVIGHLEQALTLLDQAVRGDASVQMFYVIEPFYLSRLLVAYRVRSTAPVPEADAVAASAALTGILNARPWLSDWLARAMIDLEVAVGDADPGRHTRFFLKGGRAIAYLFGKPWSGRNDWDTQILIDPGLPPAEWYALYREVSNAVLLTLTRLKNDFYSILAYNAADLAAVPVPPPPPPDPFDDGPEPAWLDIDEAPEAPPDYEAGFTRACKAELIDVGMPRRDTIEAREQWAQLQGDIIRPVEGMPIPGYAYYVDEYIAMVREFFAGDSRAPAKARKRIERLAEILGRDEAATVIVAAMQAIPIGVWTLVAPAIDAFVTGQPGAARQPLRYALIVLVDQFARALDLVDEPELAQQFAAFFNEWMPDEEALADYPPNFRLRLPVNAEAMADAIGFAQWLSGRLAAHAEARAALLLAHRAEIEALIRAVYDASIFDQRSEYEVQLAIGGALAALLHAEYQSAPHPARLEPVSRVSIGLYYEGGHINAAIAIDLVAPLVRDYLQNNPLFTLDETQPGKLRLYWAERVAIEPFGAYRPLAIEIVARRVRERPLLGYVWGLPVLGLRDLIVEYQERSAHIVEFATRRRLRATVAALIDMLTTARR